MKKVIFTLFLFVSLNASLVAQNSNYEIVYSNDTVYYNPNVPGEASAAAHIKNVSSSFVQLYALRLSNDLQGSQESYYCWKQSCYGSAQDRAFPTDSVGLYPDEVDSTMKLYLIHKGLSGTSSITMRFYNALDEEDYIDHTFTFISDPTLSISESDLKQGYALSAPYPSPAGAEAWVNYQLPLGVNAASLRVQSLDGRVLSQQPVSILQSKARINTARLSTGLYLITLQAEGRVIGSTKLTVK
jgi:hypothetical protein